MIVDDDDEFDSKYWVCNECAKKKYPGVNPGIVTATSGRCGWCKSGKTETLIPTCDYTGGGDDN